MPESKNKPMRTIATCGICGAGFSSAYEVKLHIKEVHVRKPGEVPIVVDKAKEVKEEETKTDQGKIVEFTGSNPPVIITPIELKYKFFGMCPTCKNEPRTLMLDVGDDLFAVCYCSNCDKKLKQVKVVPLK